MVSSHNGDLNGDDAQINGSHAPITEPRDREVERVDETKYVLVVDVFIRLNRLSSFAKIP